MCGLVGCVASNLTATHRNIFKTLLYIDQLRGVHATGVGAVSHSREVWVFKKALRSSDFLQLQSASDVILHADRVLIGHNRHATLGNKNDDNAHPFQQGPITLAHNGTLKNKESINDDKEVFQTDSETVAYALSKQSTTSVLESLEGAYALTWYDARVDSLFIARNDERPLWACIIEKAMFWASEKEMLTFAAAHEGKKIDEIWSIKDGVLAQYKLTELDKPVVTKFTPKETIKVSYMSGYNRQYHYTPSTVFVGTEASGWISAIRPETGYVEGFTKSGHKFCMHNVNIQLTALQKARSENKMITSKVVAEREEWARGNKTWVLTLGLLDLKIEEGVQINEKKCSCCLDTIVKAAFVNAAGEQFCEDCEDWGRLYSVDCLGDN